MVECKIKELYKKVKGLLEKGDLEYRVQNELEEFMAAMDPVKSQWGALTETGGTLLDVDKDVISRIKVAKVGKKRRLLRKKQGRQAPMKKLTAGQGTIISDKECK